MVPRPDRQWCYGDGRYGVLMQLEVQRDNFGEMATNAEKLKMLKNSRGGHRAYVTKLMKDSDALMAKGEAKLDDGEFLPIEADIETNKQIFEEKMVTLGS